MLVTTVANASLTITSQGGWFESAYVEFTPDGSAYYNVYYSTNQSSWTKIDDQLVRKYGPSNGRADVLGISAGTYYIKVASVNANGTEVGSVVSNALTVKAHDRSGFAHFNNANNVGAYKDDGTLKQGANVLYIAKANAKTISMTVPSASNKTAIYTGLQTIINAWTKAYSKGWSTAPLDIRVLGTLSYDDMDTFSSSAEGIQIKGDSNYSNCPITFEGVGNDAVIHGFGFLIRNMSNLELRNFAIMNCLDDAVSIDSNNSHIWVHNLDLFYGNAGSDKDQVKGDGTVDMKGNSQYLTVSYNHFWDTGKSSLCGMKSESGPNYITYHHNWFDHSDSRHPRIRTMSVHVYNNYFDGVPKYGTGVTMGASCFVDRNYYRNCKYPMLSSMQGSDVYAGTTTRNPDSYGTFSGENSGIIKSYGNYMTGNCTYITYGASTYLLNGTETAKGNIDTNVDFDAYEVSSPSQTVPSNVKGYQGGSTYNNFDTNISLMYSYTADNAADVPTIVKGAYGAGRMQHGTYQHTFTSADDTDYGVIASLKSDVQGYKSTSYYVGVNNSMYYKENVINDSPVETSGGEEEPETPTTSTDATLKSLTVSGYSLSFSPSQTSYSVTLAYDAESAPAVAAAANNNNATVNISQATSTTGKAIVTVIAEDGVTKKIYEVQFSVGSEPAPSGSTISSAMTINIGDGNGYASYLTGTYNTSTTLNATTYHGVTNSTKCIKMESSTAIEFTTTKAFTMTFVADANQTASFKIDGTTVAGSGNIASVEVAAGTHTLTKSGAIKMCFLDFADTSIPIDPEPSQSSDATLSALSVAGYSLTPAFSPSTLTYSVELTAGTTSVPAITATPNHSMAHAYVDTESCHPAGQAIIDVVAEDGTSGKYYINFTVAEVLHLTDAANYVDGTFTKGNVIYTRSTTAGNYGSFCLPFDLDLSEATGIEIAYVPVNVALLNTQTNLLRLFLAPKTGVIPAGTPFLAKNNGPTTIVNSADATFTSVMTNPPSTDIRIFDANDTNGLLTEDEDVTLTWNGTYVLTSKVDGMKSFNIDGSFGDHKSPTLAPFRAYLVKSGTSSQSIDIELLFRDGATSIETISPRLASDYVNVYSTVGVLIKRNVPYDKALEGLAPGAYIVNGKKIVR